MKAVLVGSDFMYRQDGKLVPIEINTNVAYDTFNRLELEEDVWHFDSLRDFIVGHDIDTVYLEGRLGIGRTYSTIESKLSDIASIKKVELTEIDSVEDDKTLTIRNTYLDEAIVDSYCRDKIAFLDLLKGTDIEIEYILRNSDNTKLVGEIKTLPDNGIYPNIIVKYRYPQYDGKVYPKMLRFETIEDMNKYAQESLEPDYYMSPFLFNEKSGVHYEDGEKRIKVVRDWSIYCVDGEKLTSISIGTYTKVGKPIEDDLIEYDENYQLHDECRDMFLTKRTFKEAIGGEVLAEGSDLILMSDGTWKPVSELTEKSEVMSLEVPTKGTVNIKRHVGDYNISFEELSERSTYETSHIHSIVETDTYVDKVSVEFDNGEEWYDTADSSYMTIDPEDGTVIFERIGDLEVGNEIILLDSTNLEKPEYVKRVIKSISKERKQVKGYKISLKENHIFITKGADSESAYVSIEHNASHNDYAWIMCPENISGIGPGCYIGIMENEPNFKSLGSSNSVAVTDLINGPQPYWESYGWKGTNITSYSPDCYPGYDLIRYSNETSIPDGKKFNAYELGSLWYGKSNCFQ